ncbi:MAG: VOC family protein [Ginsengibacter sp.]|jgi:PhnB protein
MEAVIPYLTFNGNASEALEFYANALKGTIDFKQTFGESPMETPADFRDKVMHGKLSAGDLNFMVSDCPPGVSVSSGDNLSLSLNFNDVEELNQTYAALSHGGKITMELQDTFWGARFGMLMDKYGYNWMFNHDYPKKAQ